MELIREFFKQIMQQRLRTFLTVSGIMWGTATLILLLAFGMGFRNQMTQNLLGLGDRIAIVFNGNTSLAYEGMGVGRRIQLREADAWYLKREVSGIAEISPEYSGWNETIRYAQRRNTPNVAGVHVNYGEMRSIFAREGGRWLNPIDIDERRRVVFLGDRLAGLLFEDEDPVGKIVQLGDRPFIVIGVMQRKEQNSSYSARDENRAFIPASTFSALYGTDRLNNIIYLPESPVVAAQVQAEVKQALARRHRFDPNDPNGAPVWDTNEAWEFFHYFFVALNAFLGLIGFFTLAVGGIGVANIMFVVVQERTKEIGIRRAAGAKRGTIMRQFLGESFLLVGFGASLGYAAGWGIVRLLQNNPIQEFVGTPVFSGEVAFVAFAVLSFIALSAGFMPAYRASRLNIIDCLRS
ncbi:MAG: ABC transporter permease [Candidatus Cyclonatronum sp.]|uniref:ABC transporter permease n=1 Tax=Cyclonatronum sp. TaxID=3024185 RepID=UPI0025C29E5A|nr:ABC transporter permease [Cyclonatronum sp.]MCC5932784.1 ABC transporter permease [Balneolales bacterium]MCH8485997.1 ABC transporter permease [Cyclonatronum sp.]